MREEIVDRTGSPISILGQTGNAEDWSPSCFDGLRMNVIKEHLEVLLGEIVQFFEHSHNVVMLLLSGRGGVVLACDEKELHLSRLSIHLERVSGPKELVQRKL